MESFHRRLRDECLNNSGFETCGMHGADCRLATSSAGRDRKAVLLTARPMNLLRRALQRQPHSLHNQAIIERKKGACHTHVPLKLKVTCNSLFVHLSGLIYDYSRKTAKGGVYGHSDLKAAQEAAQNAQTPKKEETTEAISCPSRS